MSFIQGNQSSPEMPKVIFSSKNGNLDVSVSVSNKKTDEKMVISAKLIDPNSLKKKKSSFTNLFKSKSVKIVGEDFSGHTSEVSVKVKDLAKALGVARKEIPKDQGDLNAFITSKLGVIEPPKPVEPQPADSPSSPGNHRPAGFQPAKPPPKPVAPPKHSPTPPLSLRVGPRPVEPQPADSPSSPGNHRPAGFQPAKPPPKPVAPRPAALPPMPVGPPPILNSKPPSSRPTPAGPPPTPPPKPPGSRPALPPMPVGPPPKLTPRPVGPLPALPPMPAGPPPTPPPKPANIRTPPNIPLSPDPIRIPKAPANLKELGLSNKDYNDISSYYKNNYKKLTEYKETTHIKGSKTKPPLPRSVVYVPSGPKKGLYILCKTKGGAKEVGIGSFNLATKMLHIDTGQEKIFRNGKKDHVPPGEIRANEEFKKIDPSSEHFATGEVVRYEGPWRERGGGGNRELNQPKDTLPRKENVEKIGLIMDLIPGGELFDTIKIHPSKRTQTNKENIGICKSIAEGLEKSHKEGLVNFDLKPENVFMSGEKNLNPKIADFGMVHKVGDEISFGCGSPGYLSPEILNIQEHGPLIVESKNEMWIMGCMMASTVKGFDLYFFIDQTNNPKKILNLGEHQFTNTVQGIFPEYKTEGSIDNAIVKCLSWNPEDRLSAAELVPILQKLYDS